MRFFARVRPGSQIDRAWRGHERRSADIHGVIFNRQAAGYDSDELSPEHVVAFQEGPNDSIELVAMGLVPDAPDEQAADADDEAAPDQDNKRPRSGRRR